MLTYEKILDIFGVCISERRVQRLCEDYRIPGISKIGYMWLIPKNAEKPVDGRRKENKFL